MLAAVELTDLLRVVVAALAAGVGVTVVFSFALLGMARTLELRRRGQSAGVWPLVALLAGLGVLAAAGLGLYAVAAV